MEALVNSVYLGDFQDSGVFRLNLADSGVPFIQSITLEDDNVISGGSGAVSGFDLDMIKVSTTLLSSPSQIAVLPGLSAFVFADSNVRFRPGFLQRWRSTDRAIWNQSQLFGTNGSSINFTNSTLGVLDGSNDTELGSFSIGEGGRVSFTLNAPLSTTGLYLYIADVGGGNDRFRLRVSSEATPPLAAGLTLIGTDLGDVIDLTQGANAGIGLNDDTINGGFGDDFIASAAGNDNISGDAGNDVLLGGTGNDLCQGLEGDDVLNGGVGIDTLVGGLGSDRFVFDIGSRFNRLLMGLDAVADFVSGVDKLVLDRSTFTRLRGTRLRASDFEVVRNLRQARSSDALFTYIRRSGALFYNENRDAAGLGRGGQFADLSNGLSVTIRDFNLIA